MKRSIWGEAVVDDIFLGLLDVGFFPVVLPLVILSVTWKMPKFIEPMLSEQSSGLARKGAANDLPCSCPASRRW